MHDTDNRWLLFIHNIPPKPPYLRAKASRRLAALGAVAIKNAVYVLPQNERARDGLYWLAREIEEGGGRAFVCSAQFDVGSGGLDDAQVRALCVEAREAQYRELADDVQPTFAALGNAHEATSEQRAQVAALLAQWRARFAAIVGVDHFGAPAREVVEGMLDGTEHWLRRATASEVPAAQATAMLHPADFQGRVWVTRPGVHVDRIASAWLIRRHIDPAARFAFDASGKVAGTRFDMAEGEFTHEGEECTFEAMVRRFGFRDDGAMAAVAAVIHDIDLDEAHPSRPESPGIAALMTGITLRTNDDEARLEHGFRVLDDLLEYYRLSAPRQAEGRR